MAVRVSGVPRPHIVAAATSPSFSKRGVRCGLVIGPRDRSAGPPMLPSARYIQGAILSPSACRRPPTAPGIPSPGGASEEDQTFAGQTFKSFCADNSSCGQRGSWPRCLRTLAGGIPVTVEQESLFATSHYGESNLRLVSPPVKKISPPAVPLVPDESHGQMPSLPGRQYLRCAALGAVDFPHVCGL